MDIQEYQKRAARTMAPTTCDNSKQEEIYVMGLIGEAGELVDHLKKVEGHGVALDRDLVLKECGDVMWYAAAVATLGKFLLSQWEYPAEPDLRKQTIMLAIGIGNVCREFYDDGEVSRTLDIVDDVTHIARFAGWSLDEVMVANIAKLEARYPAGFSHEASAGRNVEAENAAVKAVKS